MAEMHSTDHNPDLAPHFETIDQQRQSSRLGMWLFLVAEILFFGGLFCVYVIYRVNQPEVFTFGHQFLDKNLGTLNTLVLICSSLTMAWAVRAAQLRQRMILTLMLVLSFLLAGTFLGVQYVEYSHQRQNALLVASQLAPDADIPAEVQPEEAISASVEGAPDEAPLEAPMVEAVDPGVSMIAPAAAGPAGLATAADRLAAQAERDLVNVDPAGAKTFFSIYFLMAGLHGFQVLLGMIAMLWLLKLTFQGAFDGGHSIKVGNTALYWHVAVVIWIYMFLLMYLID